ncbi:GntR family transcriptional regulator [Pseudomonas putida]|uniref:GntR family transcriptional regulator n=1 Tax=Pseudomonas putida TaxID=303 RepID=UPI00335ACBD9
MTQEIMVEPSMSEDQSASANDPNIGAQNLYDSIRNSILREEFPAGHHLAEGKLARQWGVSRTPVRVALARLEGDGLIKSIPNRGAFVTGWTNADLEEIYAIRIRLEPLACRMAAGQMSTEILDHLDGIAAKMIRLAQEAQPGWVDECTQLNAELHDTILQASGANRLISIVRAMTEVLVVRRTIKLYPREALLLNFNQHIQILQALREGDGAWAESLMTAHIMGGRHAILSGKQIQN